MLVKAYFEMATASSRVQVSIADKLVPLCS